MKCKHYIWINPFEQVYCNLDKDHEGHHEGTDARSRGVKWGYTDARGNITKGAGFESEDTEK